MIRLLLLTAVLTLSGLTGCEKAQEESRQTAQEHVVDPAQEALQKAKDVEKAGEQRLQEMDKAIDAAEQPAEASEPPKP